MTSQEDKFEVDKLKLYFGEPIQINDKIIITQPTIGDILVNGEQNVYSVVNVFVTNTTAYRLQLWENGTDWNNISDYQLFTSLVRGLDVDKTRILFGDIDFTKFELYEKNLDEEKSITFYNSMQDIEIDEKTYKHISIYIKNMFNIFPKVEKAKGKTTKIAMIEEDKMNLENSKKDNEYKSTLLPLVSSCLNHPGFKYKKSELKDVGIVEFMDSVQRLQIYENTTALIKGMYSGMVDATKIDKKELNFMREV